jgi:hypothetical protein
VRLRYTNDSDDELSSGNFLRYKAGLSYDIPNCKFTPYLAGEVFQLLNDESNIYKYRTAIGGKYKLKKNHYLKLDYKFDYYKTAYKNRHVLSVGYKLNF